MKRVYFLMLLSLLLISVACNKRPKGVLDDNEMVTLLADIVTAESYLQTRTQMVSDEERDAAMKYILDKHKLTKAEFDSTINWYGRNIDLYSELYIKVDKELAKRASKSGAESIDSTNEDDLWPYSRHYIFLPTSGSNNLSFNFEPEKWEQGSKLEWGFRTKFNAAGEMMLGVKYANGESRYVSRSLGGDSKVSISLQTDSAKNVKHIFGYLLINDDRRFITLDSIMMKVVPLKKDSYYEVMNSHHYFTPKRRPKIIEKVDTLENRNISKKLPTPNESEKKLIMSNHK